MKLLTKQEVNQAKTLERKLEVDEGRKLAEKVDSLRELSAKESSSIMKYRDQLILEVKQSIQTELDKLEALKSDVKTLQDMKNALSKVDDEKMMLLERTQEEILMRENLVKQKEIEVYKKERYIEQLQNDTLIEVRKIDIIANDIVQEREKAQQATKLATTQQRAIEHALAFTKEKENSTIQALLSREAAVAVREREVAMKYEHIAKEMHKLSMRERAIIDMEETFEREIKRQIN